MKHILPLYPCLILLLALAACTSPSPMDRYIDGLRHQLGVQPHGGPATAIPKWPGVG